MRQSLRIFFLCLLVVCLPMRSMAGPATADCGMDSRAVMQQAGGHGDMPLHAPGEAAHDGADEQGGALSQSEQPCEDCEGMDGEQPSGCATCAQCCSGASGPPAAIALAAAEAAVGSAREAAPSSFAGHVPAPIERPPRFA